MLRIPFTPELYTKLWLPEPHAKGATRRIVLSPGFDEVERFEQYPDGSYRAIVWEHDQSGSIKSPYGKPGDCILPVTTWRAERKWDDYPPRDIPEDTVIHMGTPPEGEETLMGKARPGRFFPNALAWQLPTLTLTKVSIERIQDIADEEAIAEGVLAEQGALGSDDVKVSEIVASMNHPETPFVAHNWPRARFALLWNKIHGPDAWDLNAWVWVYHFTPTEGNG